MVSPQTPFHRPHVRTNLALQVEIVVLPNNQNLPLCQTGKSIELLRQRAEATRDADDLPAFTSFVFQLAGIVTILAAGREPSGYASRVSSPDGSRRTAPTDAPVWHVSMKSRSDVMMHWIATRLSQRGDSHKPCSGRRFAVHKPSRFPDVAGVRVHPLSAVHQPQGLPPLGPDWRPW